MARFFADENFPEPVVTDLRKLGHDVLTVDDIGHANQGWPDTEVLAFASQHHRMLLTMNRRHFHRLHESHPAHAGIIACTEDTDFEGLAGRIHQAAGAAPLAGQFVRIYKPSR
jgi:hypothetical protein